MRINYTLILLVFSAISINAQNKESKDLNSIIDYVTCVCVNDALPPEATKVNCNNELLTLSSIPPKENSTIELFNEFQKLRDKTNIKEPIKFFSEDVFNSEKQYSKIYAFAEKRKGNRIGDLKSKIKIFINNETNKKQENLNSDQPTVELGDLENADMENQDSISSIDMDVINNTTPPAVSTFYSFNFWTYFSIGLIILSIVLIFILNKQKSKVKKDFDNQFKSLKDKNKNEINFLTNEYSNKINRLENQIREKSIEIKKDPSYNIVNNNNNNIPETNTEIALVVPPKPAQEIFYMATPDQNNFDLSSLSNSFKPTQSLYEFTVDNQDKSKASFIFYSDEVGIKDAVNYPHRYLEPVCEPQNALNQNAKSIVTINPGIAVKRNDKWVVTTKAKIKYE